MAKTNKRRVEDPKLIEKRLPQILDAAIEQFGRNGYHLTTIRDVASHAGVSIGMIYQYVQDKEELLFLSVMGTIENYIREIEAALKGVDHPLERFVAIIAALTRVIDRRRAAAVLGYRESKSLTREHMSYVIQREREIGDMISQCVMECINGKIFRENDTEMLMYQSVVFAHNWALNAWRFKRAMTVDEYIVKGLSLILDSVLVEPGSVDLRRIVMRQRDVQAAS
ncbi:TetR/AcrR family transcriptional regulator [Rhodoligotrophos ferricapiens]|uniref:TetR/AcrR family transcriptional regulator n=1 Tax=Rhodoligotrophos ferricapiens TaxID=3069264 RepID=UPI00315DDB86